MIAKEQEKARRDKAAMLHCAWNEGDTASGDTGWERENGG